jgi:hypothetical protein
MNTNADKPAYPSELGGIKRDGLSKRELIAAMVLQGLCACQIVTGSAQEIADISVRQADALLKELDKPVTE